MNFLIYFIYRPFYAFLKTILVVLSGALSEKTKKWIQLRSLNLQTVENPPKNKNVFWFHASSGEIEYAKSLIRELKTAQPESYIVVTYSSFSAVKLFENIKPWVDQFIALPWDQPAILNKLIQKLNPLAVVFARTDFWPEFIFQLKKNNVACFVASFNPSLTSSNQLFNKIFLNHFSGLYCVHPTQETELKKVLSNKIHIATPGDTRFDQVFWRLAQPSKIQPTDLKNLDFNYAVLGSTWAEDEAIFTPVLQKILDTNIQIFWCPHEVSIQNISRIENILKNLNITYQKFSEIADKPFSSAVIIVDQVGYLADLYRQAQWAFVGGSFKAKVHSVMEPLCCAIPILTGPFIQNSPEALRYNQVIMNNTRVVQTVENSEQFLASVHQFKNLQLKDFKKMLIGHLEQNRQASKKIIYLILGFFQEKLNS